MSKIIVESKPCGNDGYTMITIKGPGADEIAERIKAMIEVFNELKVERETKQGYYVR